MSTDPTPKQSILHVSSREVLRPIRDQLLTIAGFAVESRGSYDEGLARFLERDFDLVLIDVDGEHAVHPAERLCEQVKTHCPDQLVAFVCNWRVAILTDCPDEILRSEFDPASFIAGVREMLRPA
jgi:DNA-binding response OmpR family regulator